MKKLYLISLLLISFSGFSQTKVFPDSVAYWGEAGLSGDPNGGEQYFDNFIMVGDTIVNNIKYKNLYLHRSAFKRYSGTNYEMQPYNIRNDYYALTNKIAIVRKDSLKVYIQFEKNAKHYGIGIPDNIIKSGTEHLWYNFDLKPGDTIYSPYYVPPNAGYLVVKNEHKMPNPYLFGDTLNFFTFHGNHTSGYAKSVLDSNVLIKGMGFTSSIFLPFGAFDTSFVVTHSFFGGISEVSFFCYDGNSLYHYSNCDSIDMKISIGVRENKKPVIQISPNPAKDIVTLSGIDDGIKNIWVTNISGQEFKIPPNNIAEINVADLPEGIYHIRVETDNGVYTSKFVKQ